MILEIADIRIHPGQNAAFEAAIAQGAGVVQENTEHPTRKDDPRTASTSLAGRRKTTRDSAVPSGQLRGPSAYEESAGAPSRPQFMSLCIARLVSHFSLPQSAASAAGRSFSAPPPPAAGAQAAIACADAAAISKASKHVSPMMKLACKAATPMMQALTSASATLSVAEGESEDDDGGAEAMHNVSWHLRAKQPAKLFGCW